MTDSKNDARRMRVLEISDIRKLITNNEMRWQIKKKKWKTLDELFKKNVHKSFIITWAITIYFNLAKIKPRRTPIKWDLFWQ